MSEQAVVVVVFVCFMVWGGFPAFPLNRNIARDTVEKTYKHRHYISDCIPWEW